MCANSEGSGETARMRRLVWAFAGRLCGKYHNLMSWLISLNAPQIDTAKGDHFSKNIFPYRIKKWSEILMTWCNNSNLLVKSVFFWHKYWQKLVKIIPIKFWKIVLILKNSQIWIIIQSFQNSCIFSEPARKILGNWSPWIPMREFRMHCVKYDGIY